MGNVLERMGDIAAARAAYTASLAIAPSFTQASDALMKLK
jgi:hypothetical protein